MVLKKLCNHPDLVTGGPRRFGMRQGESDDDDHEEGDEWRRFGCSRRSGKLMVTLDLLALWWEQKHKVLLFTQSRRVSFSCFVFSLLSAYFRLITVAK